MAVLRFAHDALNGAGVTTVIKGGVTGALLTATRREEGGISESESIDWILLASSTTPPTDCPR